VTRTVDVTDFQHIRAEKTEGDGCYENLNWDNNSASITLVTTGQSPVAVNLYIVHQNLLKDSELKREVRDAIETSLLFRNSEGQDEYRAPTEVAENAFKTLELKYAKELAVLKK
jgi:hypothetical protein